jgi:hypothetical protein
MVQPVGPVQKTAELDLDMGKKNPQEQPQPRSPGKAAIIDVSPEAIEKSKAEVSKIGKEVRSAEPYKGKAYSDTAIKSSGGSGGGGAGDTKFLKPKYRAGGKVRKFNDGGISLEEMYPGAKITRAGPQPPPTEGGKGSEEHIRNLEALRYKRQNLNAKPELFEEPKSKGKSGGGGGGGMPKLNRDITKNMKKGGTIKSASARADGCCIRGKTKA